MRWKRRRNGVWALLPCTAQNNRIFQKHGFDFAEAAMVLDSRYRLDVNTVRQGEARVISFRSASEHESEVYHGWTSQEDD